MDRRGAGLASDKYVHPNLGFRFRLKRPIDFNSMQFSGSIMDNGQLSAKRLASFLWFNNPKSMLKKPFYWQKNMFRKLNMKCKPRYCL